jgi:alkylated DNA repair dioxygenase AlkB
LEFQNHKNLLPDHGELYYLPAIFPEQDADQLYERLKKEISWEQKPIRIFGKMVLQPRLTAWYGDPEATYSYSGVKNVPLPWADVLAEIRKKVEEVSSSSFNSVLLNYYRNGNDSMGWHRDNEKELGTLPSIASLSFGDKRKFKVRDHKLHTRLISIEPANGSLILMKGEMQEFWEHSVPKQSGELQGRINLTFRKIIPATT